MNSSGNSGIYSTEETRIGTWIDGKPLYRKTWVSTDHANIPLPENIETVAKLTGVCNSNSYSVALNMYNTGNDSVRMYINWSDKMIIFGIGSSWDINGTYKFKNCVVILEYTKTTD